MSTPQLDLPGASEAAEPAVDTTLIARIANEIFAEFLPGSQREQTAPANVKPAADDGLARGYPVASSTVAPPVHPAAQTGPSTANALESGGHSKDSSKTYPFGEPRCLANRNHRQASGQSPTVAPGYLPSAGGDASPAYYFIRQSESPRQVPGASGLAPTAPTPVHFDVNAIRGDFPALHQTIHGKPLIWFDNAATTHKPQSVIDATSSFYSRDNSNIHRAAHTPAARATELFEGGRERARQFLGAKDTKEIIFVRGTTEAINLVAQTYGRQNIGEGDEILLTTMEHHANIVPWQMLAEQVGAVLRVAPIDDQGTLLVDQFASLLSSRTKLVAVTHVANALGTINPIEQIIALAHGFGVPVLVDGAQSTPHMPVNVQALDADFFVFSGHKIFGPTGIGVLYGKAQLLEAMPPWQGGGNMIKNVTFARTTYQDIPAKFEAGTPDIAGVVGLGAAIEYLSRVGLPAIAAYEHQLLDYATAALSTIPGLRLIGTSPAKASVLSFVIDGLESQKIAQHLDHHGIAVRSGHHCAQPSLRRFGLESTVRPSLAFYNTHEEVDVLLHALEVLPRG